MFEEVGCRVGGSYSLLASILQHRRVLLKILKPNDTLCFPGKFLHAVYTVEDAIVYAGGIFIAAMINDHIE